LRSVAVGRQQGWREKSATHSDARLQVLATTTKLTPRRYKIAEESGSFAKKSHPGPVICEASGQGSFRRERRSDFAAARSFILLPIGISTSKHQHGFTYISSRFFKCFSTRPPSLFTKLDHDGYHSHYQQDFGDDKLADPQQVLATTTKLTPRRYKIAEDSGSFAKKSHSGTVIGEASGQGSFRRESRSDFAAARSFILWSIGISTSKHQHGFTYISSRFFKFPPSHTLGHRDFITKSTLG